MTVREVRLFGDPVLTAVSTPVTTFDAELRRLVRDLQETLHDQRGAGLAAPQIGVLARVFAFQVDDAVGYLINPELTFPDDELQEGLEGCLSIPGLAFDVVRHRRVTARGVDVHGERTEVVGEGELARCLQHETDHLDGVLYLDRLARPQRKAALRAIREVVLNDPPIGQATVVRSPFGR